MTQEKQVATVPLLDRTGPTPLQNDGPAPAHQQPEGGGNNSRRTRCISQALRFLGAAVMLGVLLTAIELTPGRASVAKASTPGLSAVDTDYDGCSDKEELGTVPAQGGQRDPTNIWDYFNPTWDGRNRVDDILAVVTQYFIDYGDPSYRADTDRTTIGPNVWNLGPPNGIQRVDDILMAVKQYFHDCSGVPAPTVSQVCAQEQVQAEADGVQLATCSSEPLADLPHVSEAQPEARAVQVVIEPDKSVLLLTRDVEIALDPGTPPPTELGPGGEASGIPQSCFFFSEWVCRIDISSKLELRHFRGHGPNCAWLKLRQQYKAYRPWAAIFDVLDPVVTSSATFPCNEEDRDSSINRSGIPFWAQSYAEIKWVFGIPTPWGSIGVRSWHPTLGVWFDGLYKIHWYD